MKILLVQQKMIGDVLVSSLLCEHIKSHFPNYTVHYLIEEHTTAVIENNPWIDKIILFRKAYKSNKRRFYEFLQSIRKENYDTVIDVYGKLESNLIAFFSRAPIKITYSKWYSNFLYTHNIPILSRLPESTATTIDDRLALLAPIIGMETDSAKRPKIYLTGNELEKAKDFLRANGITTAEKLIMFSILGSSDSKTYPLNYMAQIIDFVAGHTDAKILFNYIPSQKKQANEVYNLCKSETKGKIHLEVFEADLRKYLALLANCTCLIGNEGGSVNMAKALNVPTFSIFSPCIDKQGWHTYGDSKNVAVHPLEYLSKEMKKISNSEVRKNPYRIYRSFKPSLFEKKLLSFIDTVL